MIKLYRIHVLLGLWWAVMSFWAGVTTTRGERAELAVTFAAIVSMTPVMAWMAARFVRGYLVRRKGIGGSGGGRMDVARYILYTAMTIVVAFLLFLPALGLTLVDHPNRGTIVPLSILGAIAVLGTWGLVASNFLDRAEEQRAATEEDAESVGTQRGIRIEQAVETSAALAREAVESAREFAREAKESSDRAVEVMVLNTGETRETLNDLTATTKNTQRQAEAIHTLVNSGRGVQLEISARFARRIAALTNDPADAEVADQAEQLLREHNEQQAIVDSGPSPAPTESGAAPEKGRG